MEVGATMCEYKGRLIKVYAGNEYCIYSDQHLCPVAILHTLEDCKQWIDNILMEKKGRPQ